jgi:ParB-like chromosome segregation protein Spo0J
VTKRGKTEPKTGVIPQTDLSIVYRPVNDLIPYARNARTHSEAQVAQIAASMREFGWTNPVLIDENGGIVAGHGRVLAAKQLGMDSAPCIVLAHMTEQQRRLYAIADNKLALNAGWDEDMLRAELTDLKDLGLDLELTVFDTMELAGSDPRRGCRVQGI